MRLVIEDADYSKIGIPAGEYDLDDLGAVKAVNVTGSPGAHHDIEIELRLHTGMKPEPGSTDEPCFKFGVSVEEEPQYARRKLVVFGRDHHTGAQSVGYAHDFNDHDLAQKNDYQRKAEVTKQTTDAVEAVARELTRFLIANAVAQVLKPGGTQPAVKNTGGVVTGPTSPFMPAQRSKEQRRQDKFFGLGASSKPAGTCDECGGSGVWKNPANGAESDCSKGCPKVTA